MNKQMLVAIVAALLILISFEVCFRLRMSCISVQQFERLVSSVEELRNSSNAFDDYASLRKRDGRELMTRGSFENVYRWNKKRTPNINGVQDDEVDAANSGMVRDCKQRHIVKLSQGKYLMEKDLANPNDQIVYRVPRNRSREIKSWLVDYNLRNKVNEMALRAFWLIPSTASKLFVRITDISQKELTFKSYILELHVKCHQHEMFGNLLDGGWEICTWPPYNLIANSCLVYSFGINNEWSFDDSIAQQCGCKVNSFDPSMGGINYKHSDNVWFYGIGLNSFDRVQETQNKAGSKPSVWNLLTFASILRKLNDTKNTIDYVKIDIEFSEWASMMQALTDKKYSRIFDNVKQIGIELHTVEMFQPAYNCISDDEAFDRYYRLMELLFEIGFRKWYARANPACVYSSPLTGNILSYCYELVYINKRFALD